MNARNREYFEHTAEGMAPRHVYRSDQAARAALGIADDTDTVRQTLACPVCEESRVDWLIIQDDERVECQTCGAIYNLDEARGDYPGDFETATMGSEGRDNAL